MPLTQFYLLMNKLGYSVGHLPFEEWCEKLEACTNEENVLRILSCLFTDKRLAGESLIERFGSRQAEMDTGNTDRLLAGSGIVCPPVDEALMKSYLNHFAECGYIPRPAGKAAGVFRRIANIRKTKK